MSPNLLDMPDVVLNKLMEDIGIKAIITLRKVCHDLRNFIDDVKPDANLKKIKVYAEFDDFISIDYYFSEEQFYQLEYKKHNEGCLVKSKTSEQDLWLHKELKDEDFITVFVKDFEIVLRHQKSVLKDFELIEIWRDEENTNEKLWESLQRILKSRIHPLKVEKFTTVCKDQNQIMSILPSLDSNTMNRLELRSSADILEIDQLVQLDHWRNIKHINLYGDVDSKYIQHFSHFLTSYTQFKTTRFPDLISIKNICLQSSGFNTKITSTDSDPDVLQRSIELLGAPLIHSDNLLSWYYRIPASKEVLEISLDRDDSRPDICAIILARKEGSWIPEEAVIQN